MAILQVNYVSDALFRMVTLNVILPIDKVDPKGEYINKGKKFKTLYLQTKDCYQIWEAAKVALAAEETGFAAEELKFAQGRISQNAFYDAQDALSSAREKVATTGLDLFTSYNNYRWAVDHGVLN